MERGSEDYRWKKLRVSIKSDVGSQTEVVQLTMRNCE